MKKYYYWRDRNDGSGFMEDEADTVAPHEDQGPYYLAADVADLMRRIYAAREGLAYEDKLLDEMRATFSAGESHAD